jgi:hypothetical protein
VGGGGAIDCSLDDVKPAGWKKARPGGRATASSSIISKAANPPIFAAVSAFSLVLLALISVKVCNGRKIVNGIKK